ncbi:MAG: hypothetical protein DRG24_01940 [Epsilonproteobacteria bacterium]|nr:MAG: hypothetical protein DRG24_01940 [Campylobacterota bacterium]
MSLDINNLASEFGCTVEDIKELIGSFIQESKDMFEVIILSLEGNDYESINMGAESIKIGAQNLQLSDMQKIADEMLSCAVAQDKERCSETFATMQALLSELEKAI